MCHGVGGAYPLGKQVCWFGKISMHKLCMVENYFKIFPSKSLDLIIEVLYLAIAYTSISCFRCISANTNQRRIFIQ